MRANDSRVDVRIDNLTRIGKRFEADTYFPYINFEEWDLVDLEVIDDDPQVDYSYRFEVWERSLNC